MLECAGPGRKIYRLRYKLILNLNEFSFHMPSIDHIYQEAVSQYNQGKFEKSLELFKTILGSNNGHAKSLVMVGLIEKEKQNLRVAIQNFQKAIEVSPKDADAYCHLGILHLEAGRKLKAFPLLQKAVEINPNLGAARGNLASLFQNIGQLHEAEFHCRKAIQSEPHRFEHFRVLADILTNAGKHDEAIVAYERALSLNPKCHRTHSNYLLSLLYTSRFSIDELFSKHKAWEIVHHRPPNIDQSIMVCDQRSSAKLRIGYVSRDFRRHSVAFFIEPIFYFHNKDLIDIYCYSDVRSPDEVTLRLKEMSTQWHDTDKLASEELCKVIREDQIDILIDLGGHAGTRLQVFAMRAAPIQITYLGYPYTTGLSNMDYRLTDIQADPIGEDKFYSEKLIRMPDSFLCFSPFSESPDIGTLPYHKTGYITFGSCNNMAKITLEMIQIWARILLRIPRSKLILKNKFLGDESVRTRIMKTFDNEGVGTDRIECMGFDTELADHLQFYNRIDVALDTFPYNGTTTTFEAMWMGVPVLTIGGEHHVSRVGVSILSTCGLTRFIAKSKREYILIAKYLSENVDILANLRKSLRDLMIDSNLCNGQLFTQKLEQVYFNLSRCES